MEVFYNLISSFWVCVARYSQNIQNKNFAIFFQYLKENVKDKVDFLPAIKLILSFKCVWRGLPILPEMARLLFRWNILRTK